MRTLKIAILLGFGALNLMFFQNCSGQQFSRPEADDKVTTFLCDFSGVSIQSNPQVPTALNTDIQFSINTSASSVSWGLFKDQNNNQNAEATEKIAESQDINPTLQLNAGFGDYIIVAQIQSTQNDQACEHNLTRFINIPDPSIVPVGTGCFVTSSSENGSLVAPWKIQTCECLQAIETQPGNSNTTHAFRIERDLDCSSLTGGFKSIRSFEGVLDGNSKKIRNITLAAESVALIDRLFRNAKIQNVTFDNIVLAHSARLGNVHAALAQYTSAQSRIENVIVQNAAISGTDVGGLVGFHSGKIINSNISGSLEGRSTGGIAFHVDHQASVENSLFDGVIRFSLSAGGGAVALAGTLDSVRVHADFQYVPADTAIFLGGLASTTRVGSSFGVHNGRILNSRVLQGSTATINKGTINSLWAVKIGRIAASHFGEISNTQAQIDISISASNSTNANSHIQIGGIASFCAASTSSANNITSSGAISSQGISYDTGIANINKIRAKWTHTIEGEVCAENNVSSSL